MNRPLLKPAVFALGLLVVAWIGAGYVGSHTLALLVTVLIAGLYAAGGVELHRYGRATAGLAAALEAPPGPEAFVAWLERLDPSLRSAVRQRIEGGQAPLPAPALAPYLVGMLVLLGMLGTLLGMLVTLRGTGLALQSASDLQAVRGALAAPVEGLGVAFGTSIAGVAASAALGLLAALVRRERAATVRVLDAVAADGLRVHTRAHQRDESLRLMALQAEAVPTLVERMDAMMLALERQSEAAHARQVAQQDAFHGASSQAWERLAARLSEALEQGAAASARAAAEAVQPAVATAMETVAREAVQLNGRVADAVERQLASVGEGLAANAAAASALWERALAAQAASQQALGETLRGTLDATGDRFAARSSQLVDSVANRLGAATQQIGTGWSEALAAQQAQHDALARHHREALAAQQLQHDAMAERQRAALDAAGEAIAAQAATLLSELQSAHARQQSALESAHALQQSTLAGQDAERFAAWRAELEAMAEAQREQLVQAAEAAALQQASVADALARAAADIGAQSQAHAAATIAEISTLVEAASEAPRAAAEVVAELRQKLSDSMVRDTAMLSERTQLMQTLATLLEAVNHASTEQRGAIDALVSTTSGLLETAGARFDARVDAGTGAIEAAVRRVDANAEGVSRLGEALGGAVEQFGERNAQLVERLDAIAAALEAAGTRGDEQLAYYVAQARELVDLSVLAQQQVIGELRQLPGATA
ncbi:DUF802 domain-containing protein [Luteimonas sp. MC1750]|uniref:DUF802 domain-containing protein n=1 Tax=Luteimonas sp. MC1750 TaxID=2799326 RepID=UPI0018F0B486|nr:DUF802 domain-containing protein [Luteimonas sp. MC1750]MBJ6983336.1 DUF802 domain-containing protein [Luteimonas sp. MC1750]QQO06196.1 DUF802 domain-containing protein [Luteimonas sp. MC1750]